MLLTFSYQILLTPYQRKIHVILTNQQQFSTVCLVIDHRNDVNVQNPSETVVVSLQCFEHFYIISMVYKSTDHGELLLLICFLK